MAMNTEPGGAGRKVVAVVLLLAGAGLLAWVGLGRQVAEETASDGDGGAELAAPAIGSADGEAPAAETPAAEGADTAAAAPEPEPPAVPEASGGGDAAPAGETEAGTADAGGGTPSAPAEDAAGAPPPDPDLPEAPETMRPTFDVVRVGPDGSAIVAGRAEPGARVDVRIDGATVGEAQADAQGGFVAILDLGRSDAPRAMSLNAETGDGAADSEQVVIVAPSSAGGEPEVPEPAPSGTEVAGTGAEPAGEPAAPETAAAEPAAGPAATVGEAPSVILADRSGVRVLQGGETPPEVADNVVIDAITYDAEGEVALSGRAPSEGHVRVYIDNAPVEAGPVGPGGQWRVDLPDVDTGTYTLRVDQIDAGGQVVSRAETPFRREAPEAIQALAEEQAEEPGRPLVELVTVQPGNTLWGISQRMMGEGTMYVQMFEANRGKIRDPDLIYPGQVFSVPN